MAHWFIYIVDEQYYLLPESKWQTNDLLNIDTDRVEITIS